MKGVQRKLKPQADSLQMDRRSQGSNEIGLGMSVQHLGFSLGTHPCLHLGSKKGETLFLMVALLYSTEANPGASWSQIKWDRGSVSTYWFPPNLLQHRLKSTFYQLFEIFV